MTTEQTEPLTDAMTKKLLREAEAAGDAEMAKQCRRALAGSAQGEQAVADAINDARGMDDSRRFVRVVPPR